MSDDLEKTDELLTALARSLGVEVKGSGPIHEDTATDLDQTDIQAIPKVLRAAADLYKKTAPAEARQTWNQVVGVLNKAADDIERTVQVAMKV